MEALFITKKFMSEKDRNMLRKKKTNTWTLLNDNILPNL